MKTLWVIGLLLCIGAGSGASESDDKVLDVEYYIGGVAFLFKGDVCLANIDGGEIINVTHTGGLVRDFRISPDLKYLAYTKVFGMVDDVGYYEDDEEVPKAEIFSIVIFDMISQNVITEINPTGDWLYLKGWAGNEIFIYYSSSGYDVSGFYRYDVTKNITQPFDYAKEHNLFYADYSDDGSRVLYVDDTGLGKNFTYLLHLNDKKTGDDKILLSKRETIFNPVLSHDMTAIAFFERQSAGDSSLSVIWRYNIEDEVLQEVTSCPSKKAGNSELSWSAGDSCLGLFHAPSQQPNGFIFALSQPDDIHILSGEQFCWVGDDRIIYSRGEGGIYLYDMRDRKESNLNPEGTNPVYLYKGK